MISRTTPKFWQLFDELSSDVHDHARRAYAQFVADHAHPALNFKKVGKSDPVYSVRIGLRHRALGLLAEDTVTWFWIGHHDAYDKLLRG